MTRIEYFLQQLTKFKALGIEFESGKPLRFRFAEGDKFSTTPIEHAQIMQVVSDTGQPSALEELRSKGQARVRYHSAAVGADFQVDVVRVQPQVWKVSIVPGCKWFWLESTPIASLPASFAAWYTPKPVPPAAA